MHGDSSCTCTLLEIISALRMRIPLMNWNIVKSASLCLHPLHLSMCGNECPSPSYPITAHNEKTHYVSHIQSEYSDIGKEGVPQSTTGILEVANLVQKVQMGSGNKAIVQVSIHWYCPIFQLLHIALEFSICTLGHFMYWN